MFLLLIKKSICFIDIPMKKWEDFRFAKEQVVKTKDATFHWQNQNQNTGVSWFQIQNLP